MSLTKFFTKLEAEREARTQEERHGPSVLILFDGKPIKAVRCQLPDATLTDAVCLTPHVETPSGLGGVWTRQLAPGPSIYRRGRIAVEQGVGVRFIDERAADITPEAEETSSDLGHDMARSARLRERVCSKLFAGLLYAALCNTTWRHVATDQIWHCSWRHAGCLVAGLRGQGSYLDWYCWGHEGEVDEQVLLEIEAIGWQLVAAEPVDP